MDNNLTKQFDAQINNILNNLIKKQYIVKGIVHLLLILYVARLAPTLPQQVLTLFENAYFKLFVFSLVLWTAQFSPSTSILIALGFMVSVNYATNKPLWEFLKNIESRPMDYQQTESQPMEYHSSVEHMAPIEEQPQPVQQPQPDVQQNASGCYPIRKVDMTNVVGLENTEYGTIN
jgi:hypothetical protein